MSFVQNYGIKDPEIPTMDEIEEWCESQIILFGKLTTYGEELYEQSKMRVYDEEQGEWIYV